MTTAAPTATATVAEELVSLCRAGRFLDAVNTLYSDDIVSVESMGNEQMPREMKGIKPVREKGEWWAENNIVHSSEVEGPFVGDDKFAVYYNFDVTSKPTGKRQPMEEVALYTVKDGKIVHEHFFYRTS
jgi:ketosteroid isomerase-like protein